MSYQEFEQYDKFEKKHWWFSGRRKILKIFLSRIPYENEKSILEVGCGSGGNLLYLFNRFKQRTGFDYNKDALSFAQKKLQDNAKLIYGDANCLTSLEGKYDVVAFLDVLYHQNISDVQNVINQSEKVLNSNGYLLITDGAFHFLKGRHGDSVASARRFTLSELEKILENKFNIIKISYWGVVIFALLFLKRVILEATILKGKSKDQKMKTDLLSVPIVDDILFIFLCCESFLLKYINLPFGASVAVLAQKKE